MSCLKLFLMQIAKDKISQQENGLNFTIMEHDIELNRL